MSSLATFHCYLPPDAPHPASVSGPACSLAAPARLSRASAPLDRQGEEDSQSWLGVVRLGLGWDRVLDEWPYSGGRRLPGDRRYRLPQMLALRVLALRDWSWRLRVVEVIAGRYELVSSLGRGGMGEVFLASDVWLRRRVAIKRILGSVAGGGPDAVAVERMVREARLAAGVHHPNVVAVHDLIAEDGQVFIVMEYVEARSLAEMIRAKGTLDPNLVGSVGAQVAAALEAAHRMGVTHRDVKPANILVDDAGIAKLADFGIARGVGDSHLTGTGMMIGSVAFMAPEVARGDALGPASDVYSLGATLFAAVEGHAPFARGAESSTSMGMLARLITEPAPLAAHAGPLTGVIARMMAADPAVRPTAGEVQRTLVSLTADATAAEPRVSTTSPTAQPIHGSQESADPSETRQPQDSSRVLDGAELAGATVLRVPADPPRAVADPSPTRQNSAITDEGVMADSRERGAPPEPGSGTDEQEAPTALRGSATSVGLAAQRATKVDTAPSTVVSVPAAGTSPSQTSQRRKTRLIIAGGGIVAVLVIATLVALANNSTQVSATTDIASAMTDSASADPQATKSTPTSTPSIAPRVIHTIKHIRGPHDVAVDPSAHRAYVPSFYDNSVSVIDTSTNKVTHTIKVGKQAWGVAVDPSAHRAYVTNADNRSVSVIDTRSNQVTHTIKVGGSPMGVAVDPSAHLVYVTNADDNSVSVIDPRSNKVTHTIKVGGHPGGVAVDPTAHRAYVANDESNTVSVVDTRSNKVVKAIKVGNMPAAVAVDQAGGRVFVTNVLTGSVSVIDTRTNKVTDTIWGQFGAQGVALDPLTTRLYVVRQNGQNGNSVSVIDTTTYKVTATIEVGEWAWGVALDPEAQRAYVANTNGNSVSVIDG